MKINVAGYIPNSNTNGDGLRFVLFVSGCSHKCKGCHNEELQNKDFGEKMDIEEINDIIMKEYPLIEHVTFSGGEPFESTEGLYKLAMMLRENGIKTIWSYTGSTFEKLSESTDENVHNLLSVIDVLVDGPYIESLEPALYRGSNNQRLIDVKESLNKNKTIFFKEKEMA